MTTSPPSTRSRPSAPAVPPPGAPQLGDVLLGRYRIESVIDEGGMGIVLGARHLHLDEPVAIKVMRPELARQQAFVERFVRESQAASKLRSDHVVRVFDVGVLETGLPFMVMELLEGESLSERIQRSGPLDPAFAIDLVLQACDAIAQAHGLGIIHRDLKPDNLFLTTGPDGSPRLKVLDFGISKFMNPASGELGITTTTDVFGSPRYMSPEQMRSAKDADARSDIWSLGAIVYELLAGKPSFDAGSMPELSAKILRDEPQPLLEVRPDVPEGLDRVVRRCLEKDPANRFATVAELAHGLAEHGSDEAKAAAARIARILKLAPQRASTSRTATPSPTPPPVGPAGAALWSSPPAMEDKSPSARIILTPVPTPPGMGLAHTLPELPQEFHAAETMQARMPAIPGSTQTQWEGRRAERTSLRPRRMVVRVAAASAVVAAVLAAGGAWLALRSSSHEASARNGSAAAATASGGDLTIPTSNATATATPTSPPSATATSLAAPTPPANPAATSSAHKPPRRPPVSNVVVQPVASAAPAVSVAAPAPPVPPPAASSAAPAPARPGLFDYRN